MSTVHRGQDAPGVGKPAAEHHSSRAATQTIWAGRSLVLIGSVHLVIFVVQAAALGHLTDWLTGGLLSVETLEAELSQSQSYFWLSIGSSAVPMALLGLLIIRMGRAKELVPGYLLGGLTVWTLVCCLLLEPSGFPLLLVPVILLFLARRATHEKPA
ncbi:DUF6463 family protein [Prauserella cavernicola]|uniref:Uncharacterized protein n=1 Tax=Prauserella cavernicola TaxID=2800127 RepID=A0A934V6Q5_9PSEU|nr:DUF6463 family protein [Prauserella cavernicola]MBK1786460.1 hypothetical protein [Prauserella cavernicola]